MLGLGSSITSTSVNSFAPNDISGLEVFLKFNKDIVANSGNSTAAGNMADGEDINSWADHSGNGNNASQSTAAKKPHWETDAADLGAVYFHDPSADVFMDLGSNISISANQDFSIIARIKTTDFSAARAIVGYDSQNVLKIGNNKKLTLIIGGAGASAFEESSDTLATDTYYIISAIRSNGSTGNLNIYVEGGSYSDKDWDAAENHTDADALTINNIAASSDGAIPFLGFMKDILIYKGTALSADQRAELYKYLKQQV